MLNPTDTLKLACGRCGHQASLSRTEAFARFGPGAMPLNVRDRVRCAECGERSDVRVWI